jgi:hypothetical protein
MPVQGEDTNMRSSLQQDFEGQVEKFVLKLNLQNTSTTNCGHAQSLSLSFQESKHGSNVSYLRRLIKSPLLPKINRPRTTPSNDRQVSQTHHNVERRTVSAGPAPTFGSNNKKKHDTVNNSFKNLSMHREKYGKPPNTPPLNWGFASSKDGNNNFRISQPIASLSSIYSRPSTAPLSLQKIIDNARPSTSPVKSSYGIKRPKKDDQLSRHNATLTPLELGQMKMGLTISRKYLAGKKHAKDQMGLTTLLQIGQKYHAAVIIQSLARMYAAKKAIWGPKGSFANYKATKIQAVFRGFASRHREELDLKAKRHLSSIIIQAYFRRKLAINMVITMQAKLRENAMALIQRIMRGAIARKFVKRKIFTIKQSAATRIQTHWRRYITNTMHGVVQQRRKERAIQRRTIKLHRTGMIEKAYFKDQEDELLALKFALGLIIIDRKYKYGNKVLIQSGEHGQIQKILCAIIGLASNIQVEKHLAVLWDCQINKNNNKQYYDKKNRLKKESDDKMIETFSTLSRNIILGWVCYSPLDIMPLIYYAISLLIFDFIVYKHIRDAVKQYAERLITRISKTPLAIKMQNQINNLIHIFNTWFLKKPNVIMTYVVKEDKYNSSRNNYLTGHTISVSLKCEDWLLFNVNSTHQFWPSLIVKVSKNVGGIKNINTLAVNLCSQLRAIKRGKSSYLMVIPHVEHTKQLHFYARKKNQAAAVIQRNFILFLRDKKKKLHNNSMEIIVKQERQLQTKLTYRENIRKRRHELVSKVKASFVGHKIRLKLENLNIAAVQCQKIIRGMLGKLKFQERKNWELFGAQILTMFDRGRCVSGTFLLLQIFRSGHNYLIRGNDFENGCTYQGLIRDDHVRALVRCHPYGRDSLYSLTRAPRLRIWHYDRITALLIKCLAMTDAIHGLGELDDFDGQKVMICDIEMKAKAHGPSILSRSGLGRILLDTKHIVFPPEGSHAWKKRQKQKLIMEKRKRAQTAPAKNMNKKGSNNDKRPNTTK